MAFQRCSSGGGSMPELNNIQTWLRLGGVTGSYATMQDILSDTTALNKLMASGGAVNYLVGCDDFISEICASSNGMSAIGASNYCANSLLSHNNWNNSIVNSEYVDSVLNIKVPTMTSNTTPSGQCFSSPILNSDANYAAWKAFDGKDTTYSNPKNRTNGHIGYKFTTATRVLVTNIKNLGSAYGVKDIKIQGSNDGSTYTDVKSASLLNNENLQTVLMKNNSAAYLYWRVYWLNNQGASDVGIRTIQFYGRADV